MMIKWKSIEQVIHKKNIYYRKYKYSNGPHWDFQTLMYKTFRNSKFFTCNTN